MKPYEGKAHSGQLVPSSGTYSFHHKHSAACNIALLTGRLFPFCPKCANSVHFVLVHALPVESALGRFRLLMGTTYLDAPAFMR